jgi:nitrite reductase/ring-hydroxylating ferredoxin subunit
MGRTRLCATADVPDGGVIRVDVEGHHALAVYCLAGRYHVTDDQCTHARASLSEGEVRDGLIECPFHGGSFEIATGRPVDPPCVVPLRTYAVEVSDGAVLADLGGCG